MDINFSIIKRFFLFSVLIIFGIKLSANNSLSENAEISIITCEAGNQTYTAFGHSAIHVKDLAQNIDIIFNYGTFDFNTPNFYTKFASGRLDYMLSVLPYPDFIEFYKNENRSVYTQKLRLTNTEKQILFNALVENFRLENRFYRYDFFIDNCATRIDDIIQKSLQTNWIFKAVPCTPYTYRTALNQHLQDSKWTLLGLNILLGTPTDKMPHELFLPNILKDNYSQILHNGKKITSSPSILYKAKHTQGNNQIPSPKTIFYTLAFVLLLASIFRNNSLKYIDFILFSLIGIAGIIISYTSFFSEYMATKNNWNLFWAIPTHLIIAFFILFKKNNSQIFRIYFTTTLILSITVLIFATFPNLFGTVYRVPYSFPFSQLIPILLCIIIRSIGQLSISNSKYAQK